MKRDAVVEMGEQKGYRIRPTGRACTRMHRTLDERILVRFPGLAHSLISLWSRLPTGSRLRCLFMTRVAGQLASAANRRDWEVLLLAVDADVDYSGDVGVGGFIPDLVGHHRGHAGFIHVWRTWLEGFEEHVLEIEELIDLGNRVFAVTRLSGRGAGSGVPVDQRLFQVITLQRGLIYRQTDFDDRRKALAAAGLSESE